MNRRMRNKIGLIALLSLGFVHGFAQTLALEVKNDSIIYNRDEKGNQVIDFSYCGYRSSDVDIPTVKNMVEVSWQEGDNSARLQKAIDYVSSLKLQKDGFRGTVLLDEGCFELNESLRLSTSGVIVRGKSNTKTILQKNGVDRGAIVYIEGGRMINLENVIFVESSYVPLNSMTLELANTNGLEVGERIRVVRPSTKEWIESIGCHIYGGGISALGWKPGDTDLTWDRTIIAIEGNAIKIDAPLTMALDKTWGDSYIIPYDWKDRVANVGIENLTIVSAYDTNYPKDEEHAWTGISIDNAENCWVRKVDFKNLAGSAVFIQSFASKITVEDCIATDPVSEVGGMRRETFLTMGQQTLFQRCYSEGGIHDFAVGYNAAGPNAFVQCEAVNTNGFSGAIGALAPGILFDIVNIEGDNLVFKNLGQNKNGAGWNTANSLFWQCTAAEIECYSPSDDAVNRAYGNWAQFSGNGEWAQSNNHIQPRSFFYAQLGQRLGMDMTERARLLPLSTSSTSSPTIEQAGIMAQQSKEPRQQLVDWVRNASLDLANHQSKLLQVDDIKAKNANSTTRTTPVFAVENGKLLADGVLLTGGKHDVPWWNGNLKNTYLPKSKMHITRFVPGREGKGLTDRIDSVVNYMAENDILILDHNYGLWYDRRRDDHQRVKRRDGDAWGPFYEQPFARSSEGVAWDGLSKYDLTRPNAWYWSRLKEFAQKGAQNGQLLFHENYFQHNILEAGAHWVDSPWRSANNINNTDFLEPVNFSGDKRIFVADEFYDINHPVRRELHRQYIHQCLDNFADSPNVIQLISAEYTGPLHFVEFWLDVIKEWEQETGKNTLVALSTTKDVQDSILNNPSYVDLIDIIDIRYWHYNTDGLYAPEGGKNLAPRQHARKMKVGKVTYGETYKAVSEYTNRFPNKSVTFFAQNYPNNAWAIFMAGGSCPQIPIKNKAFLKAAAQMKPQITSNTEYELLVNSDIGCIIYSHYASIIPLSLMAGEYRLNYVNPSTGEMDVVYKRLKINGVYDLDTSKYGNGIYWLERI